MGNRHPTITPYETFEASDGEFVVAVGNDEQWKRLCKVIDRPELGNDPHFNTNRARVAAHDQLQPLLAQVFKTRTRKVWIECLNEAGIPCGAVRNIAEVLADPQLAAREMIASLNHPTIGPLKMLGVPTKLSDTPGSVRTPPPTLGQHTEYVLTELLDLSADEIVALQKAGAI
jgi:CoA:oxalate CoA-transferase